MCVSLDHRDQGLRVGEGLPDLGSRRRRAVELEVRELGPVWKSTSEFASMAWKLHAIEQT